MAIRQFTIDLSAGWMGAADEDKRSEGVISVCSLHAAHFDGLMDMLNDVTDETLTVAEVNATADDQDDQDQDDEDDDRDQDDEDDEDDHEPEEQRPATGRQRGRRSGSPAPAEPEPVKRDKEYNRALRAWARDAGYNVPNAGRINDTLHAGFSAAGYPGLTLIGRRS
ncbi:Lsr2 family DNA-binding protein [Yinghuangia sp. YIM S09857]|uniref:Lsr2 family DNA-binding protein n=1 Tax=Yinghuangia sp. YIM S09857 TaxID=3436929 RepID=UPI003F53ACD6